MEQVVLNATERIKGTKKFKEAGYIPGVIYGDSINEAIPVKFEEIPLKRIIAAHGSKVKLWVKLGESKKFGVIKELQKDPAVNKIIHLDIQLVAKDHEIKAQIPIVIKGEEILKANQLKLTIHKSDITVIGKIADIPEVIHVDVSEKKAGDTITIEDLNLNKNLKTHDKLDENFGVVTRIIEEVVEAEAAAE